MYDLVCGRSGIFYEKIGVSVKSYTSVDGVLFIGLCYY